MENDNISVSPLDKLDNNDISVSTEQELVSFLRELANSVEKGEMDDRQLHILHEFKVKYHFYDEDGDEESADDTMKYLFLGWYIYKNKHDLF